MASDEPGETPAELQALLADPPSALQMILDDPSTPEEVKAVVRVAIQLEDSKKAAEQAAAAPSVVTNLGNPLAPVDTASHWQDPFMEARLAAEKAAAEQAAAQALTPDEVETVQAAAPVQVPPSPIVFAEPAPAAEPQAEAPTADVAVQAMLDDPDVPEAMKEAIRTNLGAVKGVMAGLLASLTDTSV
jgi:hypothetical protein